MSFLLSLFKSPKRPPVIPTHVDEDNKANVDVEFKDVDSVHSDESTQVNSVHSDELSNTELDIKLHNEDLIKRKEQAIKLSIQTAYNKKTAYLRKQVEIKLVNNITATKVKIQNNLIKKINNEKLNNDMIITLKKDTERKLAAYIDREQRIAEESLRSQLETEKIAADNVLMAKIADLV